METDFDAERVCQQVKPMLERSQQCSYCIDPFFTLPWAKRLLGRRTAKALASCCRDLLSLAPMSSSIGERKHLLGQACRPRKRGRAPGAAGLHKATYVLASTESGLQSRCLCPRYG